MSRVRVAVVAEWYPSPADPVHGIWAHRQALAAREAGAEVHVLALRRPVPPLRVLRSGSARALRDWAAGARAALRPFALDGLAIEPVPFLAPPRPWSYGAWGHWAAPPLARALGRLHARRPLDVVHAHSLLPTAHAALRWTRAVPAASRPALVASTHGPDVIHVAHRSALARRATRAVLAEADLVLANSRWAERRCAELAPAPPRTRVVHLGTDVPDAPPPKLARPTVVTVAHLQARKRHDLVLRALAQLRPRRELDYLIVGDGETRAALERLAAELGLAGRVRFAGQLDHPAALAAAWSAHVFAMPSAEEPFGVAYVEAMAGGVPAIGARGEGGPEDIAAAGEGMTLVPPDDVPALARAIEECLERAEPLGAAARRTVAAHFSWERCGRATLAAYEAARGEPR